MTDGTATSTYTITVTVNAVDDAPVGSDTSISVTEGTSVSGTLPPAIDPEGNPIIYGLGSQAGHGMVVVNPDGTYAYAPAEGYFGPDSFTYTVSDGTSTVSYTVSITVDRAVLPEQPKPPLEVDPPVVIPVDPVDLWQPDPAGAAQTEGAFLMGSITEDLDGIAELSVHGPILNVVNSIRSLNGIGSLPQDGAVIYAAQQMGDWVESGRIIDEMATGFFDLRHDPYRSAYRSHSGSYQGRAI